MRANTILINKLQENVDKIINNNISLKEADKYTKLASKFGRLFEKRDKELFDLCDKIENTNISDEDAIVMLSEHLGVKL